MGSRKKLLIAGLILLGGVAALVFGFSYSLGSACSGESGKVAVSPDGKNRATISSTECPMADQAYQLKLASFWGDQLVFSHYNSFDFCWKSNGELLVESMPAPLVIEREARGVKITYGDVQECNEKVGQ